MEIMKSMNGIVLMSYHTSREAGTLDEPLRTSGWEATSTRILSELRYLDFFTNFSTIFE